MGFGDIIIGFGTLMAKAERIITYGTPVSFNPIDLMYRQRIQFEVPPNLSPAPTPCSYPLTDHHSIIQNQNYSLTTEKISRSLRKRTGLILELRRILKDARILSSDSSSTKSSPSGSSTRAEGLRPTCMGKNLLIKSLGMRRMKTATGRDIAPRASDIAHWTPLRRVAERGLPPKETMRTCPIMVTRLMAMKYQFLCRPSNTLSLLSRRRLLCQMLAFVKNSLPRRLYLS
jgi:hypothetical protein